MNEERKKEKNDIQRDVLAFRAAAFAAYHFLMPNV